MSTLPQAIPWKLGSIHRDPSGSFHSLRERRSRQLSIGVLLRSICLNWSEFGSNQLPVNSPPICPKILRITLLAGMHMLPPTGGHTEALQRYLDFCFA